MHHLRLLASLFVPCALTAQACGGRSDLNDFKNGVGIPTQYDRDGAVDPDADGAGSDAGGGDGATDNDAEVPDVDAGPANPNEADSGHEPGGDGEPAPGEIGGACTNNDDCEGAAECITRLDGGQGLALDFPGGYCTQLDCEDDNDCPSGSACFSVRLPIPLPIQIPSACVDECASQDDCRDGYECGQAPFGNDPRTFCLPPLPSLPF